MHAPLRSVAARTVLSAVLLGLGVAGVLGAADKVLVLQNVSLPSLAGEAPRLGQSIVIRGDRIEEVGPTADVKVPRGATVVPGGGRFVIPGLADTHVHLTRSLRDVDRLFALFLANGVTTVLNLEGSAAVLGVRAQVASGELLGPRIYTSGPIIRGYDAMTAEAGERMARDQIAAGYDMLKVYNQVPKEAYYAIMNVAKAARVPVIGHAVRSVGIDGALETGQHIAHMEEVVYGFFTWRSGEREDLPEDVVGRLDLQLDPAKIAELARRVTESQVYVIPNLTAYHQIEGQVTNLEEALARPGVASMPEVMVRSWQRGLNGYTKRDNPERFVQMLRRTFPFLQELTAAFQKAGVPLLAGTDVGIPVVVAGRSLHDELEELVAAGLSTREAIAAATVTAARFLGSKDTGRIEPGFVADLVLLRADPTVEIANSRTVDAVVVRGRLLERGELDKRLAGDH